MTSGPQNADEALVESGPLHELSPLVFLAAEEARRDRQATDALFLTYNVDLAFLEARLLGLCHAAGAAVTVIADADTWSPDVRSVRLAGRYYHVGLVATAHAFHPKLALLAGPDRVVAIIGSGNLTLGGWQYNAELATVVRADRTAAPRAVEDLRDVLLSLPEAAPLDPLALRAVRRCTGHLDRLLETAEIVDTGHRLAASWQGPVIDALPREQVDELRLCAPFHDPAAAAVRDLLERFQPGRVRIAVQPGWTVLEPTKLRAVLHSHAQTTGADVEVIRDEENPERGRYRHGKLIEWVTGRSRAALSGSPNLSIAALLRDAPAHGNFELAVVGPVRTSLFPTGVPIDLTDVPAIREAAERAASELASPLITSVLDRDGGVTLRLARMTRPVEVEISRLADQPDQWQTVCAVAAGSELVEVDGDTAGGSRIRLAWMNAEGSRCWSAVHFVTDQRTAAARRGGPDGRSRSQRTQPQDLWGDDLSFLDAVMGDLSAVASELAARTSASAMVSRTGDRVEAEYTSAGEDDHHVEPWLWIQSETLARLGPGLAPYALALPSLGALDGWEPEWVDTVVADTEDGLEGDTAENRQDQDPQVEAFDIGDVDHSKDDEYRRGRRRKWCEQAAQMTQLPVEVRLFALLVTLQLWLTGNWPANDLRSLQLIATQIGSLTVDGIPQQLAARVGSLSAIAVALIRGTVDTRAHDERTLLHNDLTRQAATFLGHAEPEVVERYLSTLVAATKIDYWRGLVDDCIDASTTNDPFGDLDDDLALDFTITRPAVHLLSLKGNLTNPAHRALEVIGQVEDRQGVGVWAANTRGDWALVVWQKPDLVTVSKTGTTRIRWRHQRLTGLVGPASLASQTRLGDAQTIYDVDSRPKFLRTDAAVAVLESVGISDPVPPTVVSESER